MSATKLRGRREPNGRQPRGCSPARIPAPPLAALLSGAVGQVRQGMAGVAGTTGQRTQGLSAQYANAATQLDVLEAQYEALYCSPARFEQSERRNTHRELRHARQLHAPAALRPRSTDS